MPNQPQDTQPQNETQNTTNTGFNAWEDDLARQIASQTQKKDQTALDVGAIVDEWRERRGNRPEYGDTFMRHVAVHPLIDVTRQYLYRCWNAHRMLVQHGDELKQFHLRPSALMQLARITQSDLGPEDQKRLLLECADEASKRDLSAERVRQSVTNVLKAHRAGTSDGEKTTAPHSAVRRAEAAMEVIQQDLTRQAPEGKELLAISEALAGLLGALTRTVRPFAERVAADPQVAARWAETFDRLAVESSAAATALRQADPERMAA